MREFDRPPSGGEIDEFVVKRVKAELESGIQSRDILDILDEIWRVYSDEVISKLLPEILKINPHFLEDPNPIIRNQYPKVDTLPGKTEGEITFEDIWKRSPYSEKERQILKNSIVGLAGFGGLQLAALILARNGVGNFIISDPDIFESTNANRQALAFSHTLGKKKSVVGFEYLKAINSEVNIKVVDLAVAPENFSLLLGEADVIVDATGDFQIRKAVHEFARKAGKPIMTCAWAGWEGQIATFIPGDPLYTEVFSYSPPSWDRGNDSAGISIMSSIVARDVVRILLKDIGNIVSYPHIFTFNVLRKNPVQIRNVREIKKRNERN